MVPTNKQEVLHMSKLFNVVGVSAVRAGAPLKFRVANGKPARRARILERNGHADIFLVSLEVALGKDAAIAAFKAMHTEYADIDAAKRKAPARAEKVAPVVEAPVVETETVELSAAAKLALKRAKDAARKREKRAAEKAAKLAA